MLEQEEAMLAVPDVSSLISYRSRTKRTPFTVSGTQSMGGKDPCPAHGKESLTAYPVHQSHLHHAATLHPLQELHAIKASIVHECSAEQILYIV